MNRSEKLPDLVTNSSLSSTSTLYDYSSPWALKLKSPSTLIKTHTYVNPCDNPDGLQAGIVQIYV